jgi:ABC-type multidrug transport system fused ATPase/permease subunit
MATESQEEKKKYSFKKGIQGIKRHLKPTQKDLIVISILGVIASIAAGASPFVIGKFFDALITISENGSVNNFKIALTFLALWAVANIVYDFFLWIADRMSRKVRIDIHTSIQRNGFIHLIKLPTSFHKTNKIQDLMERLGRASWRVSELVTETVQVVPSLLSLVFGLVLALMINVQLTLILLVGVVIYGIVLSFSIKPAAKLDEQTHEEWNKAWDIATNAVTQVESVKQVTAEAYEEGKINDVYKDAFTPWYKMEIIWSNINFFQRVIVFLTQVTFFMISLKMVSEGIISVGDLVAFNAYSLMFFTPLTRIGTSWQTFQNGITSAGFAEEVFMEEEENYIPKNSKDIEIKGNISYKGVVFAYGDEDVDDNEKSKNDIIKNVSVDIKEGEVVALVGESGAGKSTFISLLSGYFFPQEGEVLIEGVPTTQHKLTSLRSQIAVVPQEVALFNDTIEKNIAYGKTDASTDEVMTAAKGAYLHEFIMELPNTYQTVVGERGMKLSVGQKQRVSIARAILRNPKILILDEPTSALDAMTEKNITESLEKLMEGKTTFIIAHRLSTVRKADKILVFHKGEIVETGTHEELLQIKGGYYKKLHDYQIGLY